MPFGALWDFGLTGVRGVELQSGSGATCGSRLTREAAAATDDRAFDPATTGRRQLVPTRWPYANLPGSMRLSADADVMPCRVMAIPPGAVAGAAAVLAAGAIAGGYRRRASLRRSTGKAAEISGGFGRVRRCGGRIGRRRCAEKLADAIRGRLAVRPGQEAVVPDAMEAAGQDVEEEAADELARLQRQGAVAGGARPGGSP